MGKRTGLKMIWSVPASSSAADRQPATARMAALSSEEAVRISTGVSTSHSTLTPDPAYVRFHYSHPPAVDRIAALRNPGG